MKKIVLFVALGAAVAGAGVGLVKAVRAYVAEAVRQLDELESIEEHHRQQIKDREERIDAAVADILSFYEQLAIAVYAHPSRALYEAAQSDTQRRYILEAMDTVETLLASESIPHKALPLRMPLMNDAYRKHLAR